MNSSLLPHSHEAETAFLAACLLGAAAEGVEMVAPDDFYATRHRAIFNAVCEIQKTGKPVDMLTVIEQLRNSNELDQIGGAACVSKITDMVSGVSLDVCAEIIKRAATRRRVIEACAKAQQTCFESDDIDEILGNLTQHIVAAEQRLQADSWVHMGVLADAMIERWESNKGKIVTGIPTGLTDIDRVLGGLQSGNLIIIAGRPSMGKTAMAVKIARNAARKGFPVGFRSIEMSKEQIFTRQTSDISQVDSERFKSGDLQAHHWESIVAAVGRIHGLPIYIDDKPTERIRQLQRSIRQFVKRHGHSLIIIDYLQYIEGLKSDRKDLEIGTVTRGLKASAREHGIPIILLAQLNRELEKRDNKRPRKSDLRGSGEIEQDADIIAFLYRDEVYNENTPEKGIAEFIIDKNRDGKCATVKMAWIPHRATFDNLAR